MNDGSIKIDLAVALLKKGKPEEVVSLLDGEADPLARYQLGLAYFTLGRLDEAAGSLESVVQARPISRRLGINSASVHLVCVGLRKRK